jgi:sugar-specific transcriptional regulator TrmB
MDSGALTETLEAAGLSPYQAAAYVALLDRGAAAATAVAEASGVPAPRIYDVLDALESRGYVETYQTGSLHARAHSPAPVVEDLRERAERFDAAADEVGERWEQPELESSRTSIVSGFNTVVEQAESFIDEATYQIQLSATVDDFERLRPRLVAAHERGVSTRVSIHTQPEGTLPAADRFEGVCQEARHRHLPAPFVALVDREKTCFSHHPDSADQYGVLVDDRTHTYVFHWYFLTCLWEHWETVYRDDTEGAVGYVDIRQCVRDLRPLVESGERFRVRVEGVDTTTGEHTVVAGVVTEAAVVGGTDGSTVERLAGQVSLTLDTAEGAVTVGGWGAMLEDVEARRITVLDGVPGHAGGDQR